MPGFHMPVMEIPLRNTSEVLKLAQLDSKDPNKTAGIAGIMRTNPSYSLPSNLMSGIQCRQIKVKTKWGDKDLEKAVEAACNEMLVRSGGNSKPQNLFQRSYICSYLTHAWCFGWHFFIGIVYLGFWMAYLMFWFCSNFSKFKLLKQNGTYVLLCTLSKMQCLSEANIFSFKLNWGIQRASKKVWDNQLPVGVDDLKSWLCRTNNQTNKHFTWLKFSNQNKKDQQIIGRSIPAALQPDWRDFLLSQPRLPRLIAHR